MGTGTAAAPPFGFQFNFGCCCCCYPGSALLLLCLYVLLLSISCATTGLYWLIRTCNTSRPKSTQVGPSQINLKIFPGETKMQFSRAKFACERAGGSRSTGHTHTPHPCQVRQAFIPKGRRRRNRRRRRRGIKMSALGYCLLLLLPRYREREREWAAAMGGLYINIIHIHIASRCII